MSDKKWEGDVLYQCVVGERIRVCALPVELLLRQLQGSASSAGCERGRAEGGAVFVAPLALCGGTVAGHCGRKRRGVKF